MRGTSLLTLFLWLGTVPMCIGTIILTQGAIIEGIFLELEDPDEPVRGFIDALVVQEQLWILLVESKRTSVPVPAALPQLLAYMLVQQGKSKKLKGTHKKT